MAKKLTFSSLCLLAALVLSLCFGAGAVWGLIEGILILCGKINKDAKGNPLKD